MTQLPSNISQLLFVPPPQVPEPRVWHAPEGDRQTAEPGCEGRPGGGDPDGRLQRLQGWHRAGRILAAGG